MINRERSGRTEDDTWGGLSSSREVLWTRIVVVLLAAFLGIFGIFYIDRMPETAFQAPTVPSFWARWHRSTSSS